MANEEQQEQPPIDFEQRAMETLSAQFAAELNEESEQEQELDVQEATQAEDDTQEEPEELSAEGEEEEEDEEEDDTKISVRINGKKATPDQVLEHMMFAVDGDEEEVSFEELQKGYQRNRDYTHKTQQLSKEREEMRPYAQMVAYAKHDPKFVDYVQSYFQNGPFPEAANNPNLTVTDEQLAEYMDKNGNDYDPDKAMEVLQARREWQQQATKRQEVEQKVMQERMASYSEWAQGQVDMARDMINGMAQPLPDGIKDDGKDEYERKSGQVLESLRKLGFNDDEISGRAAINATDARAAVLAYKASEYDRLIAEREAPRARIGKKRKRLSPPRSRPAGTGQGQQSNRRERDSYRRAVKTQRDEDWTAALSERLKNL